MSDTDIELPFIWSYFTPSTSNDPEERKEDLEKIKVLNYLHIGSLIIFVALFGVYLGLSLRYEPKKNHLIPISFDVGTFTSNNGAPFSNTLLISRNYTYSLWIPLVVMLGILILTELYPLWVYYNTYMMNGKLTSLMMRSKKSNNKKPADSIMNTDLYYDIITFGINLHGWIQHVVITGILFFVGAGVIGISNVILLVFFSLVAIFISILCLYTHELLSGGYVKNGNSNSILNWVPLVFGILLNLILLGPFITYLIVGNISNLGSNGWFIWTFGIGIIVLAFIMNFIPIVFYLSIEYDFFYIKRNTKNFEEDRDTLTKKDVKKILFNYTIIKIAWTLLTTLFTIIVSIISIFV